MKATTIFEAFSSIDPTLQTEADASMQAAHKKAIPRLRYAIIAATFVLLVAMIPIIVMLANRAPTPPPPQPSSHLSITNIPGATVYDATDYFGVSDRTDVVTYDRLVEILKTAPSAIGTAKHVSTVTIPSNDFIYSITVFDLTVSTPINQLEAGQTVRIISSCLCFDDGSIASRCGIGNQALAAIEQPTAFYQLADLKTTPKFIRINNKLYDLSPYADYYLSGHFETDGEKIQYWGKDIYFSEIRDSES